MRLGVVLALLAAVFGGEGVKDQPKVAFESRAVQVRRENVLTATSTIEVKFMLNLPTMEPHINKTEADCREIKMSYLKNACNALFELDKTSLSIIGELVESFKNGGRVDKIRNKRALIPWIAEIQTFLIGTANEKQLNKVIEAMNALGGDVTKLKGNVSEIAKTVNFNAIQLKGLSENLQKSVNTFAAAYNNLSSQVASTENDSNEIMFRTVSTAILQGKIDVLISHLLILKSIYSNCQNGVLSRDAVPESKLAQALAEKKTFLEATGITLAIPEQNLEMYYRLTKTKCTAAERYKISIAIEIPIKPKTSTWHVISLTPLQFLVDKLTCSVLSEKIYLATDGVQVKLLAREDVAGNNFLVQLPRWNSPSDMQKCVYALLHSADETEVHAACTVHCDEKQRTTVQQIDKNIFVILNPSERVDLICSSQLVKSLEPLNNGQVRVALPCHCTAQSGDSAIQVFISADPTCFVPAGTSEVIRMEKTWTNENFSFLHVLAPNHRVPELLRANVTIPPITVHTVAPVTGKSAWSRMPLFTSGKVESAIWVTLLGGTITAAALWLQSSTGIFTCAWKAVGCAWKLCCGRQTKQSKRREEASDEIYAVPMEAVAERGRHQRHQEAATALNERS